MSQLQTKIVISGQDNASAVMRKVGSNAQALTERITSLGRITATFFGAGAITASFSIMGKEALDATRDMDSLEKAFTSITGSASGAQAKLDQIAALSDRLGLNFMSTAQAAKSFFAAGEGTSLAGDMDRIFESVMTAFTALGLSADESSRTLLALQQMISKGKVSAEELRQQLGEALPGAFKMFADALGVSMAQLDKMLERGEVGIDVLSKVATLVREKYQAGAENAAHGLNSELNRLSNEWVDFKRSLLEADTAANAVRRLAGVLENVTANGDDYFDMLKVGLATVIAFNVAQRAANAELGKSAATAYDQTKEFVKLELAQREGTLTVLDSKRAHYEKALAAAADAKATRDTAKAELDRFRSMHGNAATIRESVANETLRAYWLEQLEIREKSVSKSEAAYQRSLKATTKAAQQASLSTRALDHLRKVGGGLVSFLGGPWGLAFTAGAAAVAYLTSRQSLAEQATKLQTEAMERLNAVTREGADGMRRFAEMNQTVAKTELGTALQKQQEALDKLRTELTDTNIFQTQYDFDTRVGTMVRGEFYEEAKSVQELIRQLGDGKLSMATFRDAVSETINRLREAGKGSSDFTAQLEKLYETAKKGGTGEESLRIIKVMLDQANDSAYLVNRALEQTLAIMGRLGTVGASSMQQLDDALSKSRFAVYLGTLTKAQASAANALKGAGLNDEDVKKALAGDMASFADRAEKIQEIIRNSALTAADRTASSADSARARLEELGREIDQLNGVSTRFDVALAKKLEAIAKAGHDAGKSAADIKALQDAYTAAFNSQRANDFAAALDKVRQQTAGLLGDSALERQAEQLRTLAEAARQLGGAASTPQEMIQSSAALAGLWGGLRNQQQIKDLQTYADFYQRYGDLTGQYNNTLAERTRLIHEQSKAWLDAGVPMADVLDMETLLLAESSRDPFVGMTRGLRKFGAEATDLAQGFESAFTGAFSSATDALADFVMTGKLDIHDLVNSMLADFARIASHQAMGFLAQALGGAIGGMFGKFNFHNPGDWTNLINTGIGAIGLHSGGVAGVDRPAFTREVPVRLFENAPRYHEGRLPYDPRTEIPAILRRDEAVFTPAQLRALAGATGGKSENAPAEPNVVVNIHNYSGQPVTQRTSAAPGGGKTIDVYVGDMAAKQLTTPGSKLNRAARHQSGQPVPVIKR